MKRIVNFTVLTLKAAINALYSVCYKWHAIGVQLEVPTFQLKIIEKKSSDLMDQLHDTLDYWMSNDSSASWRHLVDALKAPSVGAKRLAEEIEGIVVQWGKAAVISQKVQFSPNVTKVCMLCHLN